MAEAPGGARRVPLDELVVAAWVVAVSGLVILGADLLWVVALGDSVRGGGGLGGGIPFATAAQVDWPNPYALSEVLLSVVHAAGPSALAVLQVVVVATVLSLVALELRRTGTSPTRAALVVSLVAVGGSAAFAVARFPALSFVPFVLLILALRREAEAPRRTIWLVPPLLVVWANLHGGVLVGLAVLGVFTVLARGVAVRRRVLVALPSLALFALTSAGVRTPEYFRLALGNEAAARRSDLWAPPSLGHPLDVAMLLAAAVLLALAARRLTTWEWLAFAGLAAGTLLAARNGIWLVLFLAVASAGRPPDDSAVSRRRPRRVGAFTVVLALATGVASAVVLAQRQDETAPPGEGAVALVREAANGGTVLAKEPEAETFAQQGVTMWAANPIDAFQPQVQRQLLDFLHDCSVPPASLAAVVTNEQCTDRVAAHGWRVFGRSGTLVVLVPTTS